MSEIGLKYDSDKVRPSLLFKSLNKAIWGVLKVLEYGARKYSPDNWRLVPTEKYEDAMERHLLAFLSGEENDPESGLPHIDHLICSALFISEMRKNG